MTMREPKTSSKLAKLRVFARLAGSEKAPDGFAEFVSSTAVREHGLGFIRDLCKEVDKWTRELLAPEEQDLLIQALRRAKVLEEDLPMTSNTKRALHLMRLARPLLEDETLFLKGAARHASRLALTREDQQTLRRTARVA
jgi:hypothetical protein